MRRLEFSSFLPATPGEAWNFFLTPENLSRITPPDMNFVFVDGLPTAMYEGMMIRYRVSPFKRIRINWLTEISRIAEQEYFIDEQRAGPYRIWHHEHHFKQVQGGVEMKDILVYSLPLGLIGRLLDSLLVSRKVKAIFRYREERIKEIFNK